MPGSYFGTASECRGNALILSVVLMLLLQKSSSLSNVDPATKGIQILKQRKAESRVNRITDLLSEESALSSANQKELSSLLSCDTYDPNSFTEAHRTFKDNHNEIFASLGISCSTKNILYNPIHGDASPIRPIFYLDGFQGLTTHRMRSAGFIDSELFTANIFENTAVALKEIHKVNTHHGRAHDSLSTVFSSIAFCCYYLDGCSGSSQSVIDIIKNIFTDDRLLSDTVCLKEVQNSLSEKLSTDIGVLNNVYLNSDDRTDAALVDEKNTVNVLPNFAVGFTLTNAGGKDPRTLVDREQEVTKCIYQMGRKYGYVMSYVGDDPESYDLKCSPVKRDGDIQTTWVVLSLKK